LSRSPQYYIEDSLTSELFDSPDPKALVCEQEWLETIHDTGQLIKEFQGDQRWLFNPTIRIYRIPQLTDSGAQVGARTDE
jgi:hypothetical protein